MSYRHSKLGTSGQLQLVSCARIKWLSVLTVLSATLTAAAVALVFSYRERLNDANATLDTASSELQAYQQAKLRLAELGQQLSASQNAAKKAEARRVETARRLLHAKQALAEIPRPVNDLHLSASAPRIGQLAIRKDDNKERWLIKAVIENTASVLAKKPLDGKAQNLLVNAHLDEAQSMSMQLRFVVLSDVSGDKKRFYWPRKAWRQSNSEPIELAPWGSTQVQGDFQLPADFTPSRLRAELFYTSEDGQEQTLRAVIPWPE